MRTFATKLLPLLALGLGLSACVATSEGYPYGSYGYGYANPDGTTGIAPGHGGYYGYGQSYGYGYGYGQAYPYRAPGVVVPYGGSRHAYQQRRSYDQAKRYCKVQTNNSFKGKKGYTEKQVDRVYGKCLDRLGY